MKKNKFGVALESEQSLSWVWDTRDIGQKSSKFLREDQEVIVTSSKKKEREKE